MTGMQDPAPVVRVTEDQTAELDGTQTEGRANLAGYATAMPAACPECGGQGSTPNPHGRDCTRYARAAYIQGLRQLADVLEQHPEIPLPYHGSAPAFSQVTFGFHSYDPARVRAELAAAVAALPCDLTPEIGEKWLDLTGQIGGLHICLYAARDHVCTRRVTGVEVIDGRRVQVTEWAYAPAPGPRAGE